jgi:LCP family protein required for cell wall assembly
MDNQFSPRFEKIKFYKKKWFKVVFIVILILLIAGGIMAWRTGSVLNKISKGGILSSLIHSIPGVKDELKGEKEGRINILLLGMRGENIPGGGLLADTIMVASINPNQNKVGLVSIPRDLYVIDPERNTKSKINAIYAYGEEKREGGGITNMKKTVGDITGIPIHYGVSINFEGFKSLIDSLGGVEVTLDNSFSEPLQFLGEAKKCDETTYTEPSGKIETKKVTRKNGTFYIKEYPLCYPKTPSECGGVFSLSQGNHVLNGEQALCFVRSRETSNDFERAKRQQIVLKEIQEKALSLGTLTDFGKVNGLFNSIGDNVRSDMQIWEMQRLFEIYKGMQDSQTIQRVLENTEEGLLYSPESSPETGYILLPRGDNYDKIKELFGNIFNLSNQSDIKPK